MRWAVLLTFLLLAACATSQKPSSPSGASANPHYKVGQPYNVGGRWYYPRVENDYDKVGIASWYGEQFHGRLTANGEIFDMGRLSAAHTTLPMPSVVEVENLENGRRVTVRLNDRGPFVGDRIIDMSKAAADALGFTEKGLARVRVRYVGQAVLSELAPPARMASAPTVKTPAKAPAQRAKPAAPVTAPPYSGDRIADLIREYDPASAGVAGAPARELWIEVARHADLNRVEVERIRLSAFGAPRVLPAAGSDGAYSYVLQIGPFADESAASVRLAALREAGYHGARLAEAGI